MHIYWNFLIAGAQLAIAAQVGYFNADDCADPSGFTSCYQDADEWYADCINKNCEGLNSDCHDACECAHQGAYTRCAVTSCWNMVYSCEYQMQAGDNVNACVNPDLKLDDIPFWPAPDDADGRCSCPIGKVITAQALSMGSSSELCADNLDPFSQSPEEIEAYGMACLCCGQSGYLSSLSSFCPRLDPAELSMDNLEELIIEYMPTPQWTECAQWMSGYDCADFGLPSDIKTFYAPGQIPEGGTETLHNIGALQTPVSDVVTFTIGSELVLVTATSTDASVPTASSDSNKHDDSSETTDNSGSGSSEEQADSDGASTDSGIDRVSIHPANLFMVLVISMMGCIL